MTRTLVTLSRPVLVKLASSGKIVKVSAFTGSFRHTGIKGESRWRIDVIHEPEPVGNLEIPVYFEVKSSSVVSTQEVD